MLRARINGALARRRVDRELQALSPPDRGIVQRALPHTLTGVQRLQAVIDATRHVVARELPGAFAECGVWRGGSVLAMILTLQELGRDDRDIHLYDTFEGMTAPTGAPPARRRPLVPNSVSSTSRSTRPAAGEPEDGATGGGHG